MDIFWNYTIEFIIFAWFTIMQEKLTFERAVGIHLKKNKGKRKSEHCSVF